MHTQIDQETRGGRSFTPSGGPSSSPMPDMVRCIDRVTGLTTWQPYLVVVQQQRRWLRQEDAEQFLSDLDKLIAEYRPKKRILFQAPTARQKPINSPPQNDLKGRSSHINPSLS
jgi:hypothetical protein